MKYEFDITGLIDKEGYFRFESILGNMLGITLLWYLNSTIELYGLHDPQEQTLCPFSLLSLHSQNYMERR